MTININASAHQDIQHASNSHPTTVPDALENEWAQMPSQDYMSTDRTKHTKCKENKRERMQENARATKQQDKTRFSAVDV